MRQALITRPGLIVLLAGAVGLIILAAAPAQEQSRRLQVTADEIAFDLPQATLTAKNKVRLTGDGLLLTCDSLKARLDQEKGEIAAVDAEQNVRFQMRYQQQDQKWLVTAVSKRARFDPAQGLLTAEGGATVEVSAEGQQGQQYRLVGDKIEFDINQRVLVARKEQQQPEIEITLPPAQEGP